MQADRQTIEDTLGHAAARLAAKGLLKPGDVLSQRIPEHTACVSHLVADGGDAPGSFRWTSLAAPPADLHHRIYAVRPDVGAIVSGELVWTGALARLRMSLPAVFDEQVRHLGVEVRHVPCHSADSRALRFLSNGANAYCLDDVALCFGMGLERLLLNVEILEKCAESFVLAQVAGGRVRRIPWLVRYVANSRLRKDEKDAAARHLSGERSIMKAGY
ncbi:MAG: hypothetical protein M9939_13080 [Mesorhizobium sp.]|nr:hypothetical protein [Mesorhizobium sp.]MCO5162066.1 hypothetical protein [Mesorhizobium sp.]